MLLRIMRMGGVPLRLEKFSVTIFIGSLLLGVILVSQTWGAGLTSLQSLRMSLVDLQKGGVYAKYLAPPSVDWKTIPRLPPVTTRGPDKWVVTTSINPPTEAIRILANLSGWQVVVVGDTKSPKDWQLEGVIFLDVESQAKLGYRILKHVPFRSYARKNIGYLYALQHGAKVIYETDDDNLLTVPAISDGFDVSLDSLAWIKGGDRGMLAYDSREGREVVNPYVHFGQPSIWPRGYPLGAIERNSPEESYAVLPRGRQLIQQGLANGDPDVDAIFRLTRRTENHLIRVVFDSTAPPVGLSVGTMCPFNSQNTLFHYDAFWGLMIPISTAFRVCDIWRGYWAQRLLWDVGGMLAFYPPSVRQDRNIHNFFHDFLDEKALYEDAGELVHFLLEWKSDRSHFFDRVLDLSYAMARRSFWGSSDADMTLAWLQDLVSLGYEAPAVREPVLPTNERRKFAAVALPSSHLLPPGTLPTSAPAVEEEVADEEGLRQLAVFRRFFKDVVLILNYNWPLHDSVLFWRMVYGRIFKHVVVLSTDANATLAIVGVPDAENGWRTYGGLPDVFARFPEAEGFLWTNDDVVLNYWNLVGADKNKFWHIQNCTGCNPGWTVFSHEEKYTRSKYWTNVSQKKPQMEAIASLKETYQENYNRSVPPGFGLIATSDFFYIPKRFVGGMTDLIPHFLDRKIRSEMAIPSMFVCLADDMSRDFDENAFSRSRYIWHRDRRGDPARYYSPSLHAFHPWKPQDQVQLNKILEALSQGDPQLGWVSMASNPAATP